MAKTNEELTEIIYQLWRCIAKGYTYDEAKIHMHAYAAGKTTVKVVQVIEKDKKWIN